VTELTRPRTGLNALKARVNVCGLASIDRRTSAARALLERRPRAGGKTLVDHPHGGHDDHANALALAAALCAAQGRPKPALQIYAIDVSAPLLDAPTGTAGWRAVDFATRFLRGE